MGQLTGYGKRQRGLHVPSSEGFSVERSSTASYPTSATQLQKRSTIKPLQERSRGCGAEKENSVSKGRISFFLLLTGSRCCGIMPEMFIMARCRSAAVNPPPPPPPPPPTPTPRPVEKKHRGHTARKSETTTKKSLLRRLQ